MLSITPQADHHSQSLLYLPYRPLSSSNNRASDLPYLTTIVSTMGHSLHHAGNTATAISVKDSASVAQALEIARESPDGASDPTVSSILESAISSIWAKVAAQPETYVLTRDEFAVFNYFQHRFTGNKIAMAARKRYWDNARA
ncbi:hypothetical protein CGCF415_v003405 [Colletotrichum fructicola]|uniref:Uncharacterized protein n=6 Tax=Colletotrichum gloeosporioides species complex TaxID=2707338 RepID=L2FVX0_COLFN|nr:uncharacterized protein CGMCC3_g766 [Colletotrichum fructicola]XP_036489287.1 uncharacterized protein CGCS363_v013289 [Colletotrichum siamense]XP_045268310.1 uncharacterized protein GCG54_00011347 [Colletotrichum gloeosporioides]XP_053042506.1 uncharacterized protein COL26b_000490 [Colletotrichum chrysophilum]EQB59285.1 hypothetical protein CGLO_00355 [Colletotrichum gloeosporioides Cg-14]KAF0326780.1 hypothetical protein GQ607_005838 [Colletotrichum asianum]KAF4487299.1 hypothetical prote